MRFANVSGRACLVLDGRAVDIAEASGGALSSDPMMTADLANHAALRALAADVDPASWPALREADLGPPVPHPGKIIALALNYRTHAEEAGLAIPTEPHVMAKFPTCICGPGADVPIGDLEMVDYEVELVLAVGRRCKGVAAPDAWSHISGLTCGNDVSDRNEQFRPPVRQFSLAKSYDAFGPIGPTMITPDEVPNRDDLALGCRVDGEVRQQARTSDFIFDVSYLMAWLSRYVTLEVGDLIFTGTPGGVGDSMDPPTYLRHGQVVELEIEGIGTLRNRIVAGEG
ncbi:MAG: fumarylacetoacetate hydrolase family protein [Acidimicrobiia bacterium]|nr:fumarylacetoacetate hydrolase family protein [Acidimicrobiia bacterium]